MNILNAKIIKTTLGFEDHGILTFFIECEFEQGSRQSFGGFRLDGPAKNKDGWKGHAFGIACVRKIIETVGVEKWEDLKGRYLRIKKNGYNEPIEEIANIMEDNWFSCRELSKEYDK